jgi:hypothetical protein
MYHQVWAEGAALAVLITGTYGSAVAAATTAAEEKRCS